MSNIDVILNEEKFPYENMTLVERNYYLNILKNCKDICDSNHKVDNESKCEIVKLLFRKEIDRIYVDGFLTIGTNKNRENRCIEAYIFQNKDSVVVDMHITRLKTEDENKTYTVFDEFTFQDDILKRRSIYNYDMKSIYDDIENEEMKGKLK